MRLRGCAAHPLQPAATKRGGREQRDVSSTDIFACMLTLSAATTALVTLARTGLWRASYGLTAFVSGAALGQALILWWPWAFWTPEFCLMWDACLALFATWAGIELGRSVLRPARRVWQRACSWAALLCLPLAAIGVMGLFMTADAPRAGYRGLLAADAAVAGLLAVVLVHVARYELPREPLTITALHGLMRYFVAQVVYLGAWESSVAWARFVSWASVAMFAWAMLAITRVALPPLLRTTRMAK
jgi:hypothetical protein